MRFRKTSSLFISLIMITMLCCILLLAACSTTPVKEETKTTSTEFPDDEQAITSVATPGTTSTATSTTSTPTSLTTTTTLSTTETTPIPIPQVDRSAAYIYEANPELTAVNYASPALLAPSEDMGQEYIDRITFICDSPTYWMWPLELLSGGKDSKQIWTGPEGTMTLAYQSTYHILDPYDNQQRPIRDVVALHQPDILIIALGINGISFMDQEYFSEEYKDLVTDIQEISPGTILILQSIYPITHQYKHYGSITNAMITEGNSWIMNIAEETGCSYLDTISVLLNDEGNAKDELMRQDGLHPNVEGLTLILDYIRTHAYVENEG